MGKPTRTVVREIDDVIDGLTANAVKDEATTLATQADIKAKTVAWKAAIAGDTDTRGARVSNFDRACAAMVAQCRVGKLRGLVSALEWGARILS